MLMCQPSSVCCRNLEVIAIEWLGKHGSSTKGQASDKAPEIRTMLQDVQREIEGLWPERQRRYLDRVQGDLMGDVPRRSDHDDDDHA